MGCPGTRPAKANSCDYLEGADVSVHLSAPSAEYGAKLNAILENQYESGLMYEKKSKRKGLGS